METTAVRAPSTAAELVAALAEATGSVRFRGGGTKLGWAANRAQPEIELSTAGLDRILEHNVGDLTAVLEAGVPLATAQAAFAEAGQMLSLDPPDDGATIGGVVASGDSGPLRSRYGGVRDLVVGIKVALSDGTVAKAGGKVIKNVAGYDLAKMFTGSLGTLGAILEVTVRLHPRPPTTATAAGGSRDPALIARAASALAHAPLEQLGLDVRWGGGDGAVLSRFGGAAAREQAEAAARVLANTGIEAQVVDDDEAIWRVQREGQRSPEWAVARVSATQTDLPALFAATDRLGARLVGRGSLGLCWVKLEDRGPEEADAAIEELRRDYAVTVLDAPPGLQADHWGGLEPAARELMRRVRERFDPAGVCNPGAAP
jgi:glycolate oxidase FAD binding subunit